MALRSRIPRYPVASSSGSSQTSPAVRVRRRNFDYDCKVRRHLIVFAAAILGIALMSQGQPNIATGSLRESIQQLGGPNAKDCGRAGSLSVAGEGLAEPCLVQAFRSHEAAYWIQNEGSRLGSMAAAVVVTSSGAVYRLTRESPNYPVSERSCLQPMVATEYGRERLRCKESYSPPARATDIPLRSGDPVSIAPRPMTPLVLDPSVCGTGAAGEHASVEFIVSEQGKVLLAEILTAPKPCDLPALSGNLQRVQFKPGTLNGAPILTSWFTMIRY
jgi:hypothetical protein